MVTEQEARDMDIAIKAFEDKDAQARKDQKCNRSGSSSSLV